MTPSASIAAAVARVARIASIDLRADRAIGAGQVDEVERMADDGADAGLDAPLPEALERLLGVRRRAPHARALREDLDRVAAHLGAAVDRVRDAAGGRDMGAELHARTLPASRWSRRVAPFTVTGPAPTTMAAA